jgi:hypothetical protein
VDLRGLGGTITPQPYDNAALSKYLRRRVDVPVPRRVGEVAHATKGKRMIEAVSLLRTDVGLEADELIEVHAKLAEAVRIGRLLEQTERAINILNAQNPSRQEQFALYEKTLADTREEFIQTSLAIVSQGVLSSYEQLRETDLAKGTGIVNELAGNLLDAHKALGKVQSKLDELQELFAELENAKKVGKALAGGNREEAIGVLMNRAKELLKDLDPDTEEPLSGILKPLSRTLKEADRIRRLYTLASDLGTLYVVGRRLKALNL